MAKTLKEIRQQRLLRVADSVKVAPTKYQEIADSAEYQAFKSLLRTKIKDTHSTEECIECALGCLKEVAAEQVIAGIVEILADVIDRLEPEDPELPAEPISDPEPPADPEPPVDPEPPADPEPEPTNE